MSESQVFMDNGTVAHQPKMQGPLGNDLLPPSETKHFICTVIHAAMHRPDGKQLVFKDGFMETRNKQDIAYLMSEIESGDNAFIRIATEEEIKNNFMNTNPRDFYKEALRPELELEIRAELEAKIRNELAGNHTSPDTDTTKYDQAEGFENKRPIANALQAKLDRSQVGAPVNQPAPILNMTSTANLPQAADSNTSSPAAPAKK